MKYLRHPLFALTILYTVANALLLTNAGRYWDEHLWLHLLDEKNYSLLWTLLSSGRFYMLYALYSLFGHLPHSIILMRAAIFTAWLFAGMLLYATLRSYFALSQRDAFFISTLFVLSPLSLTKINLSVINFSVCILLFYLAACLYFISSTYRQSWVRWSGFVAAIIFFAFSFLMQALLALYGAFFLLVWFTQTRITTESRYRLATLLLLPIMFWFCFRLLGAPSGIYESHYNFISGAQLFLPLANNVWDSVVYGIFWPLVAALSILDKKIFAAVFVAVAALVYWLSYRLLSEHPALKESGEPPASVYVRWGGILFFFGIFAYLAVGKAPDPYGFDMRHALLLPLGTALLTLGVIRTTIAMRWQAFAQIAILALFITFSIYNYYWLDMDWYRQEAVVMALQENQNNAITGATTLVFHDDMTNLNWQHRTLLSTDYYGLTQAALHRDTLLATSDSIAPATAYESAVAASLLKPFNYEARVVDVSITSRATSEIFTVKNWARLTYQTWFGTAQSYKKTSDTVFAISLMSSTTTQ